MATRGQLASALNARGWVTMAVNEPDGTEVCHIEQDDSSNQVDVKIYRRVTPPALGQSRGEVVEFVWTDGTGIHPDFHSEPGDTEAGALADLVIASLQKGRGTDDSSG